MWMTCFFTEKRKKTPAINRGWLSHVGWLKGRTCFLAWNGWKTVRGNGLKSVLWLLWCGSSSFLWQASNFHSETFDFLLANPQGYCQSEPDIPGWQGTCWIFVQLNVIKIWEFEFRFQKRLKMLKNILQGKGRSSRCGWLLERRWPSLAALCTPILSLRKPWNAASPVFLSH